VSRSGAREPEITEETAAAVIAAVFAARSSVGAEPAAADQWASRGSALRHELPRGDHAWRFSLR